MTPDTIKKRVWKNTVAAYVSLGVRVVLGLVTFRLLYQGLDAEAFGFWSLLWAVFGYGILLDFGFGFAAQKRVAELMVKQEWEELSCVLSTMMVFYLGIAVVMVTAGALLAEPMMNWFKVSAARRDEYCVVLRIFVAGIALSFPLGVFMEVLTGQQRASIANYLRALSFVANFVCVLVVVWLKLSLAVLVVLALLCVVVPYITAAVISLRHMPLVRLRPSLFSWRTVFETSRFSLFAYFSILGNMLRNKTDQPVIGTILGVAAVTPYQAGSKVGEMYGMITRQLADVLTPTAAHLHAKGDAVELRRMFLEGLQLTVLGSTALYLLAAAWMDGVIRVLTGVKEPTATMIWAGEILLFWYYSLAITHWVFKSMYIMAGQERRMMWHGVIEAVINLALSIALTFGLQSILGVALGSVIPTVLFGWLLLWGWAAKEVAMSRWKMFRVVVLNAWLGCLPMLLVIAALRFQPLWHSGSNTWLVFLEGGFAGLVGLAGIWRLSLTNEERDRVLRKLRHKP